MLSGQEILQLKLMSYKNKGKTYIRAYRNKWVPATPEEVEKGSKGRSIPDVQIQVGVLQPDGRVKMGKKFGSSCIVVGEEPFRQIKSLIEIGPGRFGKGISIAEQNSNT